jgi:hypothetical protein
VIQNPVEGDLFDRGIKSSGFFIKASRVKVSDNSSKARQNDTVVHE